MTDLRARLAEALLQCHMTSKVIPIDVYEIADTVLSLDRIAIVELPEPLMAEIIGVEYWDCDGEQDNEMHLTIAVPEDFGPNDRRLLDSPAGKRKLAAALLAAANTIAET